MKKVTNPTEQKISIMFRGVNYSIDAGESKIIESVVADYWKTMIHGFIEVEDVVERFINSSDEIVEKEKENVVSEETVGQEEIVETKEEEIVVEKVDVKGKKSKK